MPIICLEGIDKAGKSSLAVRLADAARDMGLRPVIRHTGKPDRTPLQVYEAGLETVYDRTNPNHLLILDRWALSHLVYGTTYPADLQDKFSLGAAWHVHAFLQARGAVQVVLSPPLEMIWQRINTHGEDYLQPEHVEDVHEMYRVVSSLLGNDLPVVTDDLDDGDINVMVATSIMRAQGTRVLTRWPQYVGPRWPRLVLVGRSDVDTQAACYRPYAGTDARWLANTLVQYEVGGLQVGLIPHDAPDLPELLSTLRPSGVVAMNSAADHVLTTLDIRHGAVPGITWMHRFFNSFGEDFARAIEMAADSATSVKPWLIRRQTDAVTI